jgi:hypothetical protein
VSEALLVLVASLSILLGAPFALNYNKTAESFLFWQTLYRIYEILFCLIIIIFFGNWKHGMKDMCFFVRNNSLNENMEDSKVIKSPLLGAPPVRNMNNL